MDIGAIGRIPPQNIEAEKSVLGSMLLDKDAIPTVLEIVKPDDFYKESNREIFEAVVDIFNASEPTDIITVSEQLKTRGTLDAVGGLEYLTNLATSVPTTANVKHYAKIVEEKSLLRKLISASSKIVNMGYEDAEEADQVLDRAERNIFDIMQKRNQKGYIHIKNILVDAYDRLEELYNNKGNITGIASGFTELDKYTAGFQNSDLVLVAGRPSMGKTAFALNIAQHVAMHSSKTVAIFSLEMSKEQVVNRILCSEALVDSQKLRTGKLEDDDWKKIATSTGPLSDSPIYIDDSAATSVIEIRAKCRNLKLKNDLGLVIIDYLQLMQGNGRNENRQQEISEISRSLKILAKEINIPVIAISQLSRQTEQRQDKRPMLSDLRESGAIEQDADLVMFVYRDEVYNPDTEKKNIAEIILAKHRNGSTGHFELAWLGQYTKFANLDKVRTED